MNYLDFFHIAFAQVVIVVVALILLALDLVLRKSPLQYRRQIAFPAAIAVCIAAILHLAPHVHYSHILQEVLYADSLTNLVQIILLTLTVLTLLLSYDSTFTPHIGEYVLLILFATVGMMFLVQTTDLLVLFVSLELLSLCLYLLTGFDKPNPRSTEAALKYFLFGAMSAAFLLFGFSLLYGLSGSTQLLIISHAIGTTPLNPLAILAIVMVVIGLGFKVAAAPFHFWAPDVYEGAPAPAAAFIAAASKVASFFVFFILIVVGFRGAEGQLSLHHSASGWIPVLVVVAVVSMLLGNLVAIVQTSLRRLLAYSAVSHAGYMLLALLAHSPATLAALLYYVATYALTTLGVFAILQVIESQPREAVASHEVAFRVEHGVPPRAAGPSGRTHDRIADLAGLSRRSPLLAACLAIFLLSLAGIPPLSGFFAKFYLFTAVLAAAPGSHLLLTLIILAIGMSAVSLYYYLRVLKSAFIAEAPEHLPPIHTPFLTTFTIALIALAVILLGCAPNLFVHWITSAVNTLI
jgi:NADH-quinone oxidoreductase subunit N